jgi:three-Cys-motif partner protein
MPMGRSSTLDPDDGLPLSPAGDWAREKHRLLQEYIDASWGARRRWGRSAYIDLYSGPGRQYVDETGDIINGSPLVAWAASNLNPAPFGDVFISDRHEYASACEQRLRKLSAPVTFTAIDAEQGAIASARRADPSGLHLVFADPYNLKDLPWAVFEPLLEMKHIDFIVHFSQADLTRNLERYIQEDPSPLDTFAPGWRGHVARGNAVAMRGQFFQYWVSLFEQHRFKVAKSVPLIVNGKRAPLYRLVLFSRHPLAQKLWDSVADKTPQGKLF